MATTQPIRNMKSLKKFESYYQSVKPNVRNYTLIVLGLNSALRISDILNLTWKCVFNFKKGCFKRHLIVKEQKTGKTNRIYLNKEAVEALSSYASTTMMCPDHYLFPGRPAASAPLSRFQAYRLIREAAEYADLGPGISCHSLRKTFGYHAWKQGTPPALLMNIYNHSAYHITKHYLCIDQDDKDAVFEKILL